MGRNNAFKIASIYIGTVIGAGFASGQEIIQFFTKYGVKGIYGVMLASFLFGLIGSFVLLKVHQYRIYAYEELVRPIFGLRMGAVIQFFLCLLLLSAYCVMLAGSGALFREQFGLSKEVGIWIMSGISFLTFIFSISGLAFINSLIVPVLLIGIITAGSLVMGESGFIMSNGTGAEFNSFTGNWFTSSLLYVSYNSVGAIVVMASLLPLINNKKTAIKGGILGGLGLGVLATFLFLPTLILYTDIQGVEIPMLAIVSRLGGNVQMGYSVVLWLAMLTTAVANGLVFIQSVEAKLKLNHILISFLFCILTIPLAGFGFKNLVHFLYPTFGYIGICMALVMLGRWILHKLSIFT